MKPSMLHYSQTFLNLSETFVYNYVRNIRKFTVNVLARTTENLDLFPFERIYSFASQMQKPSPSLLSRAAGSLLRRSNFDKFCRQTIHDCRARLIHAHFGPRGHEILRAAQDAGIPLITTFYGQDMSQLPRQKEWQRKYPLLFREGDLFLTEGTCMKKGLAAIGCPEQKISIQRIAIDVGSYRFRPRVRKGKGETVILFFCGRFVEKKGLLYALDAVHEAHKVFPAIDFRIIGDGELRRDVERTIKERNMEGYVTLLGMQPHHRVLDEMDRADIFLQPSVTAANGDSEGGAPTTLLEAQACGLPVVATTHADIPEVVVDGESALLSAERDVPALAENILKLLTGACSWTAMGQAGRNFVQKNHGIEQNVQKLEEIYASCL